MICKLLGHNIIPMGDYYVCVRCDVKYHVINDKLEKVEKPKEIKNDMKPGIIMRPTAEQLNKKKYPDKIEGDKATVKLLDDIPELKKAKEMMTNE